MRAATGLGRCSSSLTMLCLGFSLVVILASAATAQTGAAARANAEQQRREAVRDSLRAEIERYAELVASLKSSVAELDSTTGLRPERYQQIEQSAVAISEAIGAVASQLSELELEVEEGQISLSDGRGGRVTLEIPENFGEKISKGVGDITRVLLDEMPDTLRIGDIETGFRIDRGSRNIRVQPVAPPPPRDVIEGGIVKLMDDLEISADEVVLGDVVVVMGDVLVEGHIQGRLVAVLGDVTLAEDAEVEGEVVTVLGRFERAEGSRVGSLTVVDPGETYLPTVFNGGAGDWIGFWGWQALFLLLMLLVLLMVTLAPRERVNRVVDALATRTTESLGVGLLAALLGHLVLLGLGAILVLTVIGIPVAILLFVAVALLDLLAVGVASLLVGRRLCARAGLGCGTVWREVALGMLVLHAPAFLAALLGAVGLPFALVLLFSWLSRLIKFFAFCFGLGALVLGRFGGAAARIPGPPVLDPAAETSGH